MSPKLLIGIGVCGVMLAAIIGVTTCVTSKRRRAVAGAPQDALLVETPKGPVLVVDDRAHGARERGSRLIAVDARDGMRLATRIESSPQLVCIPARLGRLWCRLDRLRLVDAATLSDVAVVGDTVKALGRAAGDDQVALTAEAAWITLADGRVARLDAESLAVTESGPAKPEARMLSVVVPTRSSCDLQTMSTLAAAPGRPPALLNPQVLVTDRRTGKAPIVDSPDTNLVQHDSSLETTAAKTLLSRIDATGKAVWTVELGGPCQLATVVGTSLVVATTNGVQRARAIDLATGAVVWKLAFE
jgi:hypothetical protein